MASALIGFIGDSISPLETNIIHITISEELKSKTLMVTFMMVSLSLACNVILNHPTLNKLRAVVSTFHWAMKFSTRVGVGEVRRDP